MNNPGHAGIDIAVWVLAVGVGVASFAWHWTRSSSILQWWADENGFRLIESRRCWFTPIGLFLTTSKGQVVFRVTVRDTDGSTRSGYVRCGSFWFGLLSNQADVRWDD